MIEDEAWEERPTFEGNCTCDHDRDHHGYGTCGIDDCPCKAGWWE